MHFCCHVTVHPLIFLVYLVFNQITFVEQVIFISYTFLLVEYLYYGERRWLWWCWCLRWPLLGEVWNWVIRTSTRGSGTRFSTGTKHPLVQMPWFNGFFNTFIYWRVLIEFCNGLRRVANLAKVGQTGLTTNSDWRKIQTISNASLIQVHYIYIQVRFIWASLQVR